VTLVLRGATLVDGLGGPPRSDSSVVVDGNHFSAVGQAEGRTDPDATYFDLDGLTLLPGLIDAHAHFGLVSFGNPGATPIAVIAAQIFRNCELALHAGFTTVRDTGGIDGGVRQAIDLGLVRGPRIFPSGPILVQTGGHGDFRPPFLLDHHTVQPGVPGLVQASMVCDGPDEVRLAARTVFRLGATQVKLAVSGGVVSVTDRLEDTQFSVEELVAAVEEANARETYVTVHAHNVRSIRNGLEAGVECFEHGTFLDEPTAAVMAAEGAALVPTLAVTHLFASEWRAWGVPEETVPRMTAVADAMRRSVAIAHTAGMTIGSGSDLIGPEQNRRGLELRLKADILGAMAAIVSATQTNARILRQSDKLGSVEVGKLADAIAIDGDPLTEPSLFDDPSKVVLVVKNGEVVKDSRAALETPSPLVPLSVSSRA
jgi:imidazolonepropionase-like amidohydrolase